jgi:cytoskeleton protein RodZ
MSDTAVNDAGVHSVGSRLRDARELRNLTLEDAARTTRIAKGYLKALEEDDFTKLPSEVYARGFLRVYATFLGLKLDEIVPPHQGLDEQPPPAGKHEPVGTLSSVIRTQTVVLLRRTVLPLVLVAAVIIFVLVILFPSKQAVLQGDVKESTSATQEVSPAVPGKEQADSPAIDTPSPSSVMPQISSDSDRPVAESTGLVLKLRALADGAVAVTIDEAVSEHYYLKSGDNIELKAAQYIALDLENAGGIEAELNGKILAPFGEIGEATRAVLSADQHN